MAEEAGRAAAVTGHIDKVSRDAVRGWAIDRARPGRRLAVELVVGGRVVSLAPVNQARQDLATLGAGRIDLGFTLPVPAGTTIDFDQLQVRMVGSGEALTMPIASAALEGVVDHAEGMRVSGWAWRVGFPEERVQVTISHKGDPVANVVADLMRHDLVAAGIGDGRHAFVVDLHQLPGGHAFVMADIDVRFEQNGHPLHDVRQQNRTSSVLPPTRAPARTAPLPPRQPAPAARPAPVTQAAPPVQVIVPPSPAAELQAVEAPKRAPEPARAEAVVPALQPAESESPVLAAPPAVAEAPAPAPPPPQPAPAISKELAEALLGSINFSEDD